MQFAYTVERAGDYVAHASTVIAQSAVAEGDELFPELQAHLRRRYPEVYGSAVGMCWAPERREIHIGEGERLSGGNSSVHSSIKLGAYAGRLANFNLAGMNNPIPNLTVIYLDTPLVGQTPDPLEYISLPGRLGQSSRYPPTSIGAYIGGSGGRPLPPPSLYHTHPWMHPPTGWAQLCRLMKPVMDQEKLL